MSSTRFTRRCARGRAPRCARRRPRREGSSCRSPARRAAGRMRAASLSSRSFRSVASASAPMPGRSDIRRFARSSRSATRYTFTSASGATTVPMSRPSITTSPSRPSCRCRSRITSRTGECRATTGTIRSMRVSRIDAVTSVPAIQTRPSLVEGHRLGAGKVCERVGAPEVDAALHREPGERAVHRPGVEVAEAEPLGERARHSALAGAGRPVDRNDHRLTTEFRSSKKPGKLIATVSAPSSSDAFPRREAGDGAEHRDSMVAAGVDPASPKAGRDAGDRPAVLPGVDVGAAGAQAVGDRLDPVALLDAKLGGAADDALAARMRGEQRDERQLVDEPRDLGRRRPRRHRAPSTGSGRRRPVRAPPDAAVEDLRGARPSARARRAGRCDAGSARRRGS